VRTSIALADRIHFNGLKRLEMAAATGFEPVTPCAQDMLIQVVGWTIYSPKLDLWVMLRLGASIRPESAFEVDLVRARLLSGRPYGCKRKLLIMLVARPFKRPTSTYALRRLMALIGYCSSSHN
jgi:hypothetical protein